MYINNSNQLNFSSKNIVGGYEGALIKLYEDDNDNQH